MRRALIVLALTLLGVIGLASSAGAAETTDPLGGLLPGLQQPTTATHSGSSPVTDVVTHLATHPVVTVLPSTDITVCGISLLGEGTCPTTAPGPDTAPTAVGGIVLAPDTDVTVCGIGLLGDGTCGEQSTGGHLLGDRTRGRPRGRGHRRDAVRHRPPGRRHLRRAADRGQLPRRPHSGPSPWPRTPT